MPIRKFYAIKRQSETTATKPSTVQTVNISDSDDSDFEVPPKPKKSGSQSSIAAISSIRSDIQQMRKDIQLLYKIDRHTRIPAALYGTPNATKLLVFMSCA